MKYRFLARKSTPNVLSEKVRLSLFKKWSKSPEYAKTNGMSIIHSTCDTKTILKEVVGLLGKFSL